MRRFFLLTFAVGTFGLAMVADAGAVKPQKDPAMWPDPFMVPAGYLCDFDVWEEATESHSSEVIHVDQDGNTRWIHGSGKLRWRYTNLSNGHFVDLNIPGPGKVMFPDEDTIVIEGQGPWALDVFDGDVLPDNLPFSTPVALYLKGHLKFTFDATGLTVESFTGTAQNICDMIA